MGILRGYNDEPEIEGDGTPILGVELSGEPDEYGEAQAAITIVSWDEGQIVLLNRGELSEFIRRCNHMLGNIEWANAHWIYAQKSVTGDGIYHLQKKGEHGPGEKVLCGLHPPGVTPTMPTRWTLYPVVRTPWRDSTVCKRCLAKYDRIVQE